MIEVEGQDTQGPAGHSSRYTRNNPFYSTVRVNELLTAEGSEKETRHIELTLDEGMTYTPGDSVGIFRRIGLEAVAEVLAALGFRGDERVLDHYKVEISSGRGAADAAEHRQAGARQREAVCEAGAGGFGGAEGAGGAGEQGAGRGVLLGARVYRPCDGFSGRGEGAAGAVPCAAAVSAEVVFDCFEPEACIQDNVQTTVRVIRYESHGRSRQGVASGQLGERADVGTTMPIFLHSNVNFRMPEDTSAPVIMIGPGTGIAPFRAFLEERQATGQTGDNWLFFGEQREKLDFCTATVSSDA